jgi:predicted nucleic acid-binding Zn ribbon protein
VPLKGFREASDFQTEDELRRDRTRSVGDVVRQLIARRGLGKLTQRQQIWNVWLRLLGRDASHTHLEGMKNQVVTITVDSSALLSELANFRKHEILEALHKEVRTFFVRDLRFRLEKRRPPAATK